MKQILMVLGLLMDSHHKLLNLSIQKTAAIKKNEINQLQKLLLEENKMINQITQLEESRRKHVDEWFTAYHPECTQQTLLTMLQVMHHGQEKSALQELTARLGTVLDELKQQEALNNTLTKQALSFLNLSLDMIDPSMTTINYGSHENPARQNRSFFDSKA